MAAGAAFAQSSTKSLPGSPLYKTIVAMDSTFFDAFNTCNVQKSQSLFSDDLEFYHDMGGKTNLSQNLKSINERCSGAIKMRRELVEGSLEIYSCKDFGAIEVGKHRFYYTEPGKKEQLDGTYKFVHVWQLKDGAWKISRVVSFDH